MSACSLNCRLQYFWSVLSLKIAQAWGRTWDCLFVFSELQRIRALGYWFTLTKRLGKQRLGPYQALFLLVLVGFSDIMRINQQKMGLSLIRFCLTEPGWVFVQDLQLRHQPDRDHRADHRPRRNPEATVAGLPGFGGSLGKWFGESRCVGNFIDQQI